MWKTKVVRVRKIGAGELEVKEVRVSPTDTAGKILTEAGASASMVLTADPQRAKVFDKSEVLWEYLEEGMELYCAPPTPVGR